MIHFECDSSLSDQPHQSRQRWRWHPVWSCPSRGKSNASWHEPNPDHRSLSPAEYWRWILVLGPFPHLPRNQFQEKNGHRIDVDYRRKQICLWQKCHLCRFHGAHPNQGWRYCSSHALSGHVAQPLPRCWTYRSRKPSLHLHDAPEVGWQQSHSCNLWTPYNDPQEPTNNQLTVKHTRVSGRLRTYRDRKAWTLHGASKSSTRKLPMHDHRISKKYLKKSKKKQWHRNSFCLKYISKPTSKQSKVHAPGFPFLFAASRSKNLLDVLFCMNSQEFLSCGFSGVHPFTCSF